MPIQGILCRHFLIFLCFTTVPLKENGLTILTCCGNAYGYAHAELLNNTIKCKEINLSEYENFDEAQKSIFRFIDLYNMRRPHSALGWIAPQKYE